MSLPKVSIIFTTYHEKTKPYLDLAIQSAYNLSYPKDKLEIILVARNGYAPLYEGVKTVCPKDDEFFNAEGMNFGILNAAADSEFYFMNNDDVILTKSCLKELLETVGDKMLVANPLSPCDNYRQYCLGMAYEKNGEKRFMVNQFYRLEQVKDDTTEMMNAASIYPAGAIFTGHLCMFSTLIPKKVWQTVGIFDEMFKTGPDDIDYSIRCQQKGIPLLYATSSLVWHFGGVTADNTISVERRKDNLRYFKSKWGYFPPGMPDNILETLDESYKFSNRL